MREFKGVLAEMIEEGKDSIDSSALKYIITSKYSPDWLPSYKFIETINGFGETHWTVFSWKGKYYKVKYSHTSHVGASYYGDGSEIEEVVPKQVMTTVYE